VHSFETSLLADCAKNPKAYLLDVLKPMKPGKPAKPAAH
jgi:hypothetical protein